MPEIVLHSQDINMGNEDEFILIYDESYNDIKIRHWWSHRASGGDLKFESGKELFTLMELKTKFPRIYDKAIDNIEGLKAKAGGQM